MKWEDVFAIFTVALIDRSPKLDVVQQKDQFFEAAGK